MKTALCAAALALLTLAPIASAHTVTGTYTIGNVAVVGLIFAPGLPLPLDQPLSIGGFTFPAINEVPTRVAISDIVGVGVFFTVCQDFNGQLCGEAGEPNVSACGAAANLGISTVPFQAGRATSVFVYSASAAGCVGAATTGTISLTYNV
ncbi:MAG TPA: hypothetical protein VGR28_09815 [Candidatus Thermoplasmatota archaeon]|jgi:hypothetical protein|nr:hypothetical protein [Candidatus Thermoplasmatota archaeon]